MVLDRSKSNTKRKSIDQGKGPQSKRKKSADEEDLYTGSSLFSDVCKAGGLVLKNGNKYNKLGIDLALFHRNVQKDLKKRGGQEVLEEFIEGFQEYIEEPNRFHKCLLPCVSSPECGSAKGGFQASVVKCLLGIDLIQPSLMSVSLEKLPEFIGEEDCTILEQGQKVNIAHLLLSQFQWLDTIVDSKAVTDKLLEMIGITCVDVQREIIACLSDVVQDSEHNHVASALRDVLNENKQLTVPILDALSNLILTPQLLSEIRESVLQSLISVDLEDLPVLVKFLLQSVTTQDALQVVSELRANLDFDASTAQKTTGSTSKNKRKSHGGEGEESQDTETLILDTVKSAVRFQRHVGDALIKAIELVKQPGDHKVIDLFLLLILHGTPRRKAVESVFRNKIRAGCFTDVYLQNIYTVHKQVLKGYFPSLLGLAEVLLRSPELPVCYFGCSLYKLTFTQFDVYHQQEIVGNLVAHIGSGFEGEIDASLDILADLVNRHLKKMAPFAILVKSVLDYLDNLSVCQIRKLYFMLSALAFKNPQEGGLIQDDLHIVIRKQLSNNNPKYKRMGVIGAVMIVNCIAESGIVADTLIYGTLLANRVDPDETAPTGAVSSGSTLFANTSNHVTMRESNSADTSTSQPELSPDLFKQVTSLLQLVRSSSSKSPEAYALFLDELSTIMAQKRLNSQVEAWISENLTPDFEENFVVDVDDGCHDDYNNIPAELLYRLNDEAEGKVAINLLPLVADKLAKKSGIQPSSAGMSDPLCMAPSVRLLRVCEERQAGNLENIGALLGCPLYLPRESVYEKLEPLSVREKDIMLTTLFYSINWFIEMVNGFSTQTDTEIKVEVIHRLQNITHVQKILLAALPVVPGYKPPLANFDTEDGCAPTVTIATAGKGETKKKAKKAKKGKEKDKVGSDNDDDSRDSSQLNITAAPSQAGTQAEGASVTTETKEAPSINLTAYRAFFRELDMSVFTILGTGLITRKSLDSDMHTDDVTELSLQPSEVRFLLEDLCLKLEHSLIANSSKRKSFFKGKGEKKLGFSNLDQLSPLEVATKAVKLLPALCDHLEGASGFFQTMIAENDGVIDGPGSRSPEALMMGACFQLILQALLSIFSWNGFQVADNRDLLREGLGVLVKRIKATGQSQLAFKDLIKTSLQYIANFVSTVPDITTAVTQLKLMKSLMDKAEDKNLAKKFVPLAEEFLKREWLAPDGQREKGARYNEQLQFIIKAFIIHSEDPLIAIETIATKAIPELLEADKNGGSETYPTMTRSTYSVYYKVMFIELIEAVKRIPLSKQTETFEVWMDRLLRWNIAVRILHILVNLMKTFDGRSNLNACIKYGRYFIEGFLRLGMPLLDQMFKAHRKDIQGLLKNLQLSTRALHHMCGHSKIIKDVALTNQVPMLKRVLEVFVFRVKAMLTVNKCLEAFWMGNLKNRDLKGEEILSQSTTMSDNQSTTSGESDEEALPDDEDELSDVELDEDTTEARDHDVTDPEQSYSQTY